MGGGQSQFSQGGPEGPKGPGSGEPWCAGMSLAVPEVPTCAHGRIHLLRKMPSSSTWIWKQWVSLHLSLSEAPPTS